MSQLTPCPECQRHVRKTETRCPFCDAALSLAHLPAPPLPRQRLSRAATFAFGASVVGATALVSCGGDVDGGGGTTPVYGAPSAGGIVGAAGSAVYGAPPSGAPNGGSTFGGATPVYGAPSAGTGPVYGAPTAGSGNEGGAAPVYGSPDPGGEGGAAGVGGEGGRSEGGEAGGTIYGGPPAGAGGN